MKVFEEEDVYDFYRSNVELFLKSINYIEFILDYPDSFFPLKKDVLHYIFKKTHGNPRETIKLFIKIFNEIIYSDDKIEDILKQYQVQY